MRSDTESRWTVGPRGIPVMPEMQSEFLDWLLSHDRRPASQAEWALQHDVHERTVQTWKSDVRFRAEWERRAAQKNISPERLQVAIDTIYNAAKGGDFKAAETYLKYVDRFMPAPERQTNDQAIRGMTDEELDAALMATLNDL